MGNELEYMITGSCYDLAADSAYPYIASRNYDGSLNWIATYDVHQPYGETASCLSSSGSLYLGGNVLRIPELTSDAHVLFTDQVLSFADSRNHNSETLRDIQCYPNPSNGSMNLRLNGYTHGNLTIRVYDVTGRLVLQEDNFTIGSSLIDVSHLSTGKYFLQTQVTVGASASTAFLIIR